MADGEMLIELSRLPGDDFYTFKLPDGSEEEIEATEALEWLRLRHSRPMDLDAVEKALDNCWNFYSAELLIMHPRHIKPKESRISPKL